MEEGTVVRDADGTLWFVCSYSQHDIKRVVPQNWHHGRTAILWDQFVREHPDFMVVFKP